MLIGQRDKMFRDVRSSKRSTELSAILMWFWSVVRIIMFRILCFQHICWSASPSYETQLSTCCEKCQVTNTSRQKMSLEAAKFPPHPNTCYSVNMVKRFTQGEWHTALNIYSARKNTLCACFSAVLILEFICIHWAT